MRRLSGLRGGAAPKVLVTTDVDARSNGGDRDAWVAHRKAKNKSRQGMETWGRKTKAGKCLGGGRPLNGINKKKGEEPDASDATASIICRRSARCGMYRIGIPYWSTRLREAPIAHRIRQFRWNRLCVRRGRARPRMGLMGVSAKSFYPSPWGRSGQLWCVSSGWNAIILLRDVAAFPALRPTPHVRDSNLVMVARRKRAAQRTVRRELPAVARKSRPLRRKPIFQRRRAKGRREPPAGRRETLVASRL